MRWRQGSLILSLLLLSLFFLLCLGLLSRQPWLRQASNSALLESQARALALAGLDDARSKLIRDYQFPQRRDLEQRYLVYQEPVTDLSDRPVGSFRVSIDHLYAAYPYLCYRISSWGLLGKEASYRIDAVFDLSPQRRATGVPLRTWEWMEWNEGAL